MAPPSHYLTVIHQRICRLMVVYLVELSEIAMKLTMRLYQGRVIGHHGVRTGMQLAGRLQRAAVRGYAICNFRR